MDSMNSTQPTVSNNNKTIIILIVLIIIAAIALVVMLSRQSDETTGTSSSTTETIPTATTTPIEPPTRPGMKPGEIPVPDIQITQAQLAENATIDSCWTVIDGVVYDVSAFIRRGRRFVEDINEVCGKDGKEILVAESDRLPPVEAMGPVGLYSRPVGKIN